MTGSEPAKCNYLCFRSFKTRKTRPPQIYPPNILLCQVATCLLGCDQREPQALHIIFWEWRMISLKKVIFKQEELITLIDSLAN